MSFIQRCLRNLWVGFSGIVRVDFSPKVNADLTLKMQNDREIKFGW